MSSPEPAELRAFQVVDKLRKARFSSSRWRRLGQRLTPSADLEAIAADFPRSCDDRLERVVDEWLRNGEDLSWKALAKAMAHRSVGGRNAAKRLLKALGIDPDEVGPPSDNDESESSSQEDALSAMDAKEVFEEIKEAKKKAFALGLKLKLPTGTRKRINSQSLSPDDRLLKTLEEYMKLQYPRPSWVGIVTALNSPIVGLPELANRIGESHCPGWKAVQEYEDLKSSFEELVTATCGAIEEKGIDVRRVVDTIQGFISGERDNDYFMEFTDHLRKSGGVRSLFDRLCYNWDYLHPEVYGHLIWELSLHHLEQASSDYLGKWANFIDQTPLSAFCKIPDIKREKDSNPPPGFTKCVMKLNWEPPPKYLRDVEKLRRKHAGKCNLQSCAVTIVDLRLKCIVLTMWVPESTELYVARDLQFIQQYSITQMVFNGMVIYSQDSVEIGSSVDTVRRVQPSRVSVAMKFIMKALYDRPVRRMLKHLKSPLTRAVQHGTLQEVRELIASGEDPNPHTVSTPLKEACSRGDLEIARALLEAGADPNLVTDNWTALMEASRLGNREMIRLLVEFGADANTTNSENWTALMAASNNGRTEAVDQLLRCGANPNKQDHVGWSALLASVFKTHQEIAVSLTEAGANPHLQNLEYRSALRLAIEFKQERVVDVFLDTHPDVKPGLRGHPDLDSTDKYGETDLLFACKENDLRVVIKLLRKGADPNLANLNGDLPLFAAAGYGNTEMVHELLRAGADPNLTNNKESPLSMAASSGKVEVVVELLSAGANPNWFTDQGTPLARAAKCGQMEMMEYMLTAGADPNIAEYVDQLPLYHARQLENKQMIALLEGSKADPEKEAELPGRVTYYYGRLSTRPMSFLKTFTFTSSS